MAIADNLKTMMAADVAAAVADWTSTLVFNRREISGTVSPISDGDNIDADGILQTADIEFVAALSGFASDRDGPVLPAVRDVVSVDGKSYYVESKTVDPAAVTLRLKRGP
jgi:hypothetical protein